MSNLVDILLKRLNAARNSNADDSSADGVAWQDVLFDGGFGDPDIRKP